MSPRPRRSGNFTRVDKLMEQLKMREPPPKLTIQSSPSLVLSESDIQQLEEIKRKRLRESEKKKKSNINFSTPVASGRDKMMALRTLNISAVRPENLDSDDHPRFIHEESDKMRLSTVPEPKRHKRLSKSLIQEFTKEEPEKENRMSLSLCQPPESDGNSVEEFLRERGIKGDVARRLTMFVNRLQHDDVKDPVEKFVAMTLEEDSNDTNPKLPSNPLVEKMQNSINEVIKKYTTNLMHSTIRKSMAKKIALPEDSKEDSIEAPKSKRRKLTKTKILRETCTQTSTKKHRVDKPFELKKTKLFHDKIDPVVEMEKENEPQSEIDQSNISKAQSEAQALTEQKSINVQTSIDDGTTKASTSKINNIEASLTKNNKSQNLNETGPKLNKKEQKSINIQTSIDDRNTKPSTSKIDNAEVTLTKNKSQNLNETGPKLSKKEQKSINIQTSFSDKRCLRSSTLENSLNLDNSKLKKKKLTETKSIIDQKNTELTKEEKIQNKKNISIQSNSIQAETDDIDINMNVNGNDLVDSTVPEPQFKEPLPVQKNKVSSTIENKPKRKRQPRTMLFTGHFMQVKKRQEKIDDKKDGEILQTTQKRGKSRQQKPKDNKEEKKEAKIIQTKQKAEKTREQKPKDDKEKIDKNEAEIIQTSQKAEKSRQRNPKGNNKERRNDDNKESITESKQEEPKKKRGRPKKKEVEVSAPIEEIEQIEENTEEQNVGTNKDIDVIETDIEEAFEPMEEDIHVMETDVEEGKSDRTEKIASKEKHYKSVMNENPNKVEWKCVTMQTFRWQEGLYISNAWKYGDVVRIIRIPSLKKVEETIAKYDFLIFVISGEVEVQIGEESKTLKRDVMFSIPKGAKFSFTNSHSTKELSLLCTIKP